MILGRCNCMPDRCDIYNSLHRLYESELGVSCDLLKFYFCCVLGCCIPESWLTWSQGCLRPFRNMSCLFACIFDLGVCFMCKFVSVVYGPSITRDRPRLSVANYFNLRFIQAYYFCCNQYDQYLLFDRVYWHHSQTYPKPGMVNEHGWDAIISGI
jgi:hypothetical protein